MKKIIFLVMAAALAGLVGCNPFGKGDIKVTEYKDSVVVIPSPEKQNLPKGLLLGKVQSAEGKDKAEKNMLSQFASNTRAMLCADRDNIMIYLYPDAVTYYRKQNPDLSYSELEDAMFGKICDSLSRVQNMSNHGIHVEIVVSTLERRVQRGDDIFIVFNVTGNLCGNILYAYMPKYESTLGISSNGGKNWSFMRIYEDTPDILRISYPDEVVNAVMGNNR